jgi:hypothetical protein
MGKASRRKRETRASGYQSKLANKAPKATPEILKRTCDTLEAAEIGLSVLRAATEPRQRIAGLRNVVVFGRAVTNVLQNLRSTETGFDEWYQPYVEKMESDPISRYLYGLRTRILKEGDLPLGISLEFTGDPMAVMRRFPKPPNAKQFFIGDRIGGTGWIVELPNGEQERFYVALPPEMPGIRLDVTLSFADAPQEFSGVPVGDVCSQYIALLRTMVTDARRRFAEVPGVPVGY